MEFSSQGGALGVASQVVSVQGLLSLKRFRPASVQRSFRWEAKEALQLLKDLSDGFDALTPREEAEEEPEEPESVLEDDDAVLEAEENPLLDDEDEALALGPLPASPPPPLESVFLGSIVLAEGAYPDVEIYDGLQRLTTLTILFAVIRDLEEDRELGEAYHALIAQNHSPYLRFAENDPTLMTNVQKRGATLLERDAKASRAVGARVLKVKNALLEQLEGWSLDRRRAFARFVLERAAVSVIEVIEPRQARRIFVSTNLHGRRLDQVETLKGQIAACAQSQEEETQVVQHWTEISARLDHQFKPLLKAVDMIERAEPQLEDWPSALGEHVSRRCAQAGDVRLWTSRLNRWSKAWMRMNNALEGAGSSHIERDIWRLRCVRWRRRHWAPLALLLLDRHERARTPGRMVAYERVARRLAMRSMALFLSRISEDVVAEIFVRAMGQIRQGEDPTTYRRALFPNAGQRQKIDRTLNSQIQDDEIWRGVARWMECVEWRADLPKLMKNGSVEHILPRNLWPMGDGETSHGAAWQEYDRMCYSLGNLAMLDSVVNAKLGNAEYAEKLPALKKQAENYKSLISVVSHETWGAEQIDQRATMLRELVWRSLGVKAPKPR